MEQQFPQMPKELFISEAAWNLVADIVLKSPTSYLFYIKRSIKSLKEK